MYNDALNNSFACVIYGCTDPNAMNYNPSATIDDGSCNYPVYYCNSNSIYEIPTTDIKIGESTYDLQSNATVDNRLLRHDDGTISAAWTMSSQFNSTFSDREQDIIILMVYLVLIPYQKLKVQEPVGHLYLL